MCEWLDLSCLFFFNLWPFWIVIAAAAAAAAYTALLRHRQRYFEIKSRRDVYSRNGKCFNL